MVYLQTFVVDIIYQLGVVKHNNKIVSVQNKSSKRVSCYIGFNYVDHWIYEGNIIPGRKLWYFILYLQ